MTPPLPERRLGSPPPPRRPFVPPPAVRAAQAVLAVRVGALLALLLLAGGAVAPRSLEVSPSLVVPLPGGMTWASLAPWALVAGVVEAVLIRRLGRLGGVSRRLILAVEVLVVTACVLYAVAGTRASLILAMPALAAVELLRLDHVRHAFDVAASRRRLEALRIVPAAFDGYRMPEPTAPKPQQLIGYRVRPAAVDEATTGGRATA